MISLTIHIVKVLMSNIVWPIADWILGLLECLISDIIHLPFYLIATFMDEEHPWLKILDDLMAKRGFQFRSWLIIAMISLVFIFDIPVWEHIKKF